ncbi:ATP/GTP-binding protein [Saccharothrix xinjiangensis]
MKRTVVVAGAVAVGLVLGTEPASADNYGNVTCDQVPSPLCELDAGTSGDPGRPGGNPGSGKPHRPGGNDSSTGRPGNPGDTIVGGDSNLANCSYVESDYRPPSGGVIAAAYQPPMTSGGVVRPAVFRAQVAQPGQGAGAWYVWKCTGEGFADALYRPPVWIADGQQPGAALLPSPAELAQMAREQLRLPTPTIAANPAGDQLVSLPTWMWLSSGFSPVSATASVPGVSVTATATPTSVTWAMGDGSTVTCAGAGTPYTTGTDPKAPSPDCGHVYRRSSASQAGQAFPVTATAHWTVTWSGAGQGGTFPDMTTTGNAGFRVAESQALNHDGG